MVTLSGINKSYDRLHVLRDVDLVVADGEFVSITGPSGAGKTTLLQIMGTLERPDSGTVDYDGTDVARLGATRQARFRNASIGFVFQFHQLLPEFTLCENVALPLMIAGQSRGRAMERAAALLSRLGLGERLQHRPSQVSGGERQRAAVARALVADPKVILADEPTGSLDSHNRAEIYDIFDDLHRTQGVTLVVVTHDEALAARAGRVVRMADGRIVH